MTFEKFKDLLTGSSYVVGKNSKLKWNKKIKELIELPVLESW